MSGQMSLELADAIRMEWGKFCEMTSASLTLIFMARIPESLLPYPRETIEEAMNLIIEHFSIQEDDESVAICKNSLSTLLFFVDDETAIRNAGKNFNNEEILKTILSELGKTQQDQLKYLQGNIDK